MKVDQLKPTDIMLIGREVANSWGGECIVCEIVHIKGEPALRYNCIEHGEFFYTIIKEEDIKDFI